MRALDALAIRARTLAALVVARRSTLRNLLVSDARRILVVCYGNIYRSPFVAELLQQRLGSSAVVRSAGFHRVAGRPSPPRHVEVSGRYGVSLAEHRSSVISVADVEWADLIVLMDRGNWASLSRMGVRKRQLVWLGALLPGNPEIPDPYGRTDVVADDIIQRLYAATGSLVAQIELRHVSA